MVSRDEISGWFEVLERAGREGDRQFFLEAYSGASGHSYDRVGRGSLYIRMFVSRFLAPSSPANSTS